MYKINLQPLTNLGRYLKLKEYQILSKVQLFNHDVTDKKSILLRPSKRNKGKLRAIKRRSAAKDALRRKTKEWTPAGTPPSRNIYTLSYR